MKYNIFVRPKCSQKGGQFTQTDSAGLRLQKHLPADVFEMKRIIAALLLAAGAILYLVSCETKPPDGTVLVKNPPQRTSADSTDISTSEEYTSESDAPETPGETSAADTTSAGATVDTTDTASQTSSPPVTSAPPDTTEPPATTVTQDTTAPETTTAVTTYIPEVPDSDHTHRY
jgi:hypothetical protein